MKATDDAQKDKHVDICTWWPTWHVSAAIEWWVGSSLP